MYRKATERDCKRVYDLICELEGKTLSFDRFSSIYKKQINSTNYHCVVCEGDNNVVGVLKMYSSINLIP